MSDFCEAELVDAKIRLVNEKQGYQSQLAEVTSLCKTRLPTDRFRKLQSQRAELVKRLMECENALGQIKHQLHAVRGDFRAPRDVVKILSDIRDKWSEVASDENFHPPYRLAASQFVRDLNPVLKKLCAP